MIARIWARLGMRGRLLFAAILPALLMVTVLEIVILMPGTALEEAAIVAERMRLAVAGAPTRTQGGTCGY
ncbi:MAG: hypothetical protein Q8J72_11840, partial [Rhodocyclaceae bacterium]|nr:hypothetical protein [Rhodocyclaceae bacterium]